MKETEITSTQIICSIVVVVMVVVVMAVVVVAAVAAVATEAVWLMVFLPCLHAVCLTAEQHLSSLVVWCDYPLEREDVLGVAYAPRKAVNVCTILPSWRPVLLKHYRADTRHFQNRLVELFCLPLLRHEPHLVKAVAVACVRCGPCRSLVRCIHGHALDVLVPSNRKVCAGL